MSQSLSLNNRTSILGWMRKLKKGNFTSNESIDEISSDDQTEPRSPLRQHELSQVLLRPYLQHKSRSTNNVSRVRSNSSNTSEKGSSIKQTRDSFLQNKSMIDEDSKYFGVSIEEALQEASAKISIFTNPNSDQVLQYGRIPIVVAKCGVFLKTNGLKVEGVFRVGGSSRRIKELQLIFNLPPDYGKKLNWDGYTVHDSASVLRRYLNSLPEPLIPLESYEKFREPLKKRPKIVQYLKYKADNFDRLVRNRANDVRKNDADAETNKESGNETAGESVKQELSQEETTLTNRPLNNEFSSEELQRQRQEVEEQRKLTGDFSEKDKGHIDSLRPKNTKKYTKLTKDLYDAIDEYKLLIDLVPEASKQLLFYILDLLAMVQNHALENLMPSRNLAAIFQPCVLSHPDHDLNPDEYALSQLVVDFLIQYTYKLLPKQPKIDSRRGNATDGLSLVTNGITELSLVNDQEGQEALNDASNSVRLSAPCTRRLHSKSLSHSPRPEDLVDLRHKSPTTPLQIGDIDQLLDISDDEPFELNSKPMESNTKTSGPNETLNLNNSFDTKSPQREYKQQETDVPIIISSPSQT